MKAPPSSCTSLLLCKSSVKKIFYIGLVVILLIIVIFGVMFFSVKRQSLEQKSGAETKNPMTFFVSSVNPGQGGDLGGLDGADAYCQSLANGVGAGNHEWRAYLSTTAVADAPVINARDRIGTGPWQNAKGVIIANNLDDLHGNNNINKQTALTEKGETVNGRGDTPNWHDILTGSTPEGLAIATSTDTTCSNWTSSGQGSAMVGHHDRLGLRDNDASRSWNSSHSTRGCSLELLATTGSGGLIYCFAAD